MLPHAFASTALVLVLAWPNLLVLDGAALAWGQVTDPDGDCKIAQDGDRVTIEVPGTPHDLSAELNLLNAPRILREVEGDFIAEVRVGGRVLPGGDPTIPIRTPFNGTGLLVWGPGSTYLRVERAAVLRRTAADPAGPRVPFQYASFEMRVDGQSAANGVLEIPDEAVVLRIERRGRHLIGTASVDGVEWKPIGRHELDLPARLRVGVAAINSASEPFRAELEGFRVFTPQAPAK